MLSLRACRGRKRVLKAAKHRGAVGSPARVAGEAEKAELGHRGHFQMAWIPVRNPTNITTAPVSSSKFDFNIRLTIALQLLERFRLWGIRVDLACPRHVRLGDRRVNCLTGKSPVGLSSPVGKNISVCARPKSHPYVMPSRPDQRGVSRSSRTRGGMRWTWQCR
jgi:hypothetical protein